MAKLAIAAVAGFELMKAHNLKKQKIREQAAYMDAKNRVMGAATREMAEEQRNKELMHSRAVALAAASGGGVDDPGMVTLLGDLNAEGEYRIMSRLWAGQNEAEGLNFRAKEARREADSALSVGLISALSQGAKAYATVGGFGDFRKPRIPSGFPEDIGKTDLRKFNPDVRYA